jgi:hypothetical protein
VDLAHFLWDMSKGAAAHGDVHHEHAMLTIEKALVQSGPLVSGLLCILVVLGWTWLGPTTLDSYQMNSELDNLGNTSGHSKAIVASSKLSKNGTSTGSY